MTFATIFPSQALTAKEKMGGEKVKGFHHFLISFQMRFAQNISKWVAKKPALYHGHIAYLDFSKFVAFYYP